VHGLKLFILIFAFLVSLFRFLLSDVFFSHDSHVFKEGPLVKVSAIFSHSMHLSIDEARFSISFEFVLGRSDLSEQTKARDERRDLAKFHTA
jgi:hypothetical protein